MVIMKMIMVIMKLIMKMMMVIMNGVLGHSSERLVELLSVEGK